MLTGAQSISSHSRYLRAEVCVRGRNDVSTAFNQQNLILPAAGTGHVLVGEEKIRAADLDVQVVFKGEGKRVMERSVEARGRSGTGGAQYGPMSESKRVSRAAGDSAGGVAVVFAVRWSTGEIRAPPAALARRR